VHASAARRGTGYRASVGPHVGSAETSRPTGLLPHLRAQPPPEIKKCRLGIGHPVFSPSAVHTGSDSGIPGTPPANTKSSGIDSSTPNPERSRPRCPGLDSIPLGFYGPPRRRQTVSTRQRPVRSSRRPTTSRPTRSEGGPVAASAQRVSPRPRENHDCRESCSDQDRDWSGSPAIAAGKKTRRYVEVRFFPPRNGNALIERQRLPVSGSPARSGIERLNRSRPRSFAPRNGRGASCVASHANPGETSRPQTARSGLRLVERPIEKKKKTAPASRLEQSGTTSLGPGHPPASANDRRLGNRIPAGVPLTWNNANGPAVIARTVGPAVVEGGAGTGPDPNCSTGKDRPA